MAFFENIYNFGKEKIFEKIKESGPVKTITDTGGGINIPF